MSCGWYPVVPAKCCQEEPPWSSAGITWACTGTTNKHTHTTYHTQSSSNNKQHTYTCYYSLSFEATHTLGWNSSAVLSPFRLNSIIYANIQNPPRNFAHHSHQVSSKSELTGQTRNDLSEKSMDNDNSPSQPISSSWRFGLVVTRWLRST